MSSPDVLLKEKDRTFVGESFFLRVLFSLLDSSLDTYAIESSYAVPKICFLIVSKSSKGKRGGLPFVLFRIESLLSFLTFIV